MSGRKIFVKEYSQELFRIAKSDFETATYLSQSPKMRKETILFHAQQAIEKALKANICWRQEPILLTHSIEVLLEHFDETLPHFNVIDDLSQYASIRQYEEGVV